MLNVFGLLTPNAPTIRRNEPKTTAARKKKFFRMRLKGCAFLVEHSESDLMGMHELKINFWKRVHQVLENWNTTVAVFFLAPWSRC